MLDGLHHNIYPFAFGSFTEQNCYPNLGTNIIFDAYARTGVYVTLCPEKEISVDVIAFIVLNIEYECVCVCACAFVFI